MSLVKCKECKKEISDTVKTCPYCGFKEKKKISKKNKIIIGVITLLVIIGCIASVMIINNKNAESQKQQEQIKKEYDELLTLTSARVYINGIMSQYISSQIASTWHNCITNRYCSDFNEKIQDCLRDNKKSIDKLKEEKTEIDKSIQELKKMPSEEYQDTYNKLIELYGHYVKLYNAATNPSGNYTNYVSNYNSYSSNFTSTYDQLLVLRPEIKDYKIEE